MDDEKLDWPDEQNNLMENVRKRLKHTGMSSLNEDGNHMKKFIPHSRTSCKANCLEDDDDREYPPPAKPFCNCIPDKIVREDDSENLPSSIWCCEFFVDKWWCPFSSGIGLRKAIVIPFLALMIMCVSVIIITQSLLTANLEATYNQMCSSALNQLLFDSLSFELNFSRTSLKGLVGSTQEYIDTFYLSRAVELVASTSSLLKAQRELIFVYTGNQTIDSQKEMLFRQLLSSDSRIISTVGFNIVHGPGDPYPLLYPQIVLEFVNNFTATNSVPTIPRQVEYTGPNTLEGNLSRPIEICSLTSDMTVLPDTCGHRNITTLNQDPYRIQHNVSMGYNVSQAAWSNFNFVVKPSAGTSWANETWGVTYTFPVNLPCPDHTCFRGAVFASLFSSALSNIFYDMIKSELDMRFGVSECEFCAIFTVVGRTSQHLNQSDAQIGLLAAGTTRTGPLDTGPGVFAWNNTQSPIVARATLSLLSQYGNNYSLAVSSVVATGARVYFFNATTLGPCTLPANSNKFSVTEYLDGRYVRGCFIVSVDVLIPPNQGHMNLVDIPFAWLTFLVLPLEVPLTDFTATIYSFQDALDEAETSVQDKKQLLLFVSTIVAVFAILCTFVAAWLLAGALVKPIKDLELKILQLRRLDMSLAGKPSMGPSRIQEVSRVQRAMVAMFDALKIFAKFVPVTVVRNIVNHDVRSIRVKRKVIAIMFSSIVDLNRMSEELRVQDLLTVVSTYINHMSILIEEYEGSVAEVGAGLLSFFNTPDNVEDHCTKAISCALARQYHLTALNTEIRDILGGDLFDSVIGEIRMDCSIACDEVLTGIIGSDLKMKFGALGDAMNLCSRLEGLCSLYGVRIMCSENTVKACRHRDSFLFRELDLVKVKGKTIPTKIFEVVAQTKPIETFFNATAVQKAYLEEKVYLNEVFDPLNGAGTALVKLKRKGEKPRRMVSTDIVKRIKRFQVPHSFADLDAKRQRIKIYEGSLQCYQSGSFSKAKDILETGIIRHDFDKAERYLLRRIEVAMLEWGNSYFESGTVWSGVNVFDAKTF